MVKGPQPTVFMWDLDGMVFASELEGHLYDLADYGVASKAQTMFILDGHLICFLLIRFKTSLNCWEEAHEVLDNHIS
ncbi:hypothetical protein SDJN02_03513, partial [Cucurbita argyrosperma subsp. argyrosperma]